MVAFYILSLQANQHADELSSKNSSGRYLLHTLHVCHHTVVFLNSTFTDYNHFFSQENTVAWWMTTVVCLCSYHQCSPDGGISTTGWININFIQTFTAPKGWIWWSQAPENWVRLWSQFDIEGKLCDVMWCAQIQNLFEPYAHILKKNGEKMLDTFFFWVSITMTIWPIRSDNIWKV